MRSNGCTITSKAKINVIWFFFSFTLHTSSGRSVWKKNQKPLILAFETISAASLNYNFFGFLAYCVSVNIRIQNNIIMSSNWISFIFFRHWLTSSFNDWLGWFSSGYSGFHPPITRDEKNNHAWFFNTKERIWIKREYKKRTNRKIIKIKKIFCNI